MTLRRPLFVSVLLFAPCLGLPSLMPAAQSSAASTSQPAPLRVSHLTCEGLTNPPLIDLARPRFSWRIESTARGARQTAYQLRITPVGPAPLREDSASTPAAAEAVMETERVVSDQSQFVNVPGFSAEPKRRYTWQVRVWDEQDRASEWSEPATFATGLLGTRWSAPWIGDGRTVARNEAPAARYFRTEFDVASRPVHARLFLSAFGLVEPWLNAAKVGDDYFLPGWPDYRQRTFYVTYDVTDRIQTGKNALGLILGDGWYSSTLMASYQGGTQPLVSAFLELTDETGKVTTIAADAKTTWAEGPIVAQGIYHGEDYDARREATDWCSPNTNAGWEWHPAQVQGLPAVLLTARLSAPVRRIQEVNPVSRREVRPGVFIYDLGQNMVGWPRLRAQAEAGTQVKLRFAEMLEPDGSLHTANLRAARASATYTTRGDPAGETWEPRFSFFGFRYAEVSGIPAPAEDAITGVVVHTDLPRIGNFACSNPLLNQLYANTLWGQKGNFLEVPTDCPQRDERLGWTGDAQVFANTANYNFASGAFYRQWLVSVRDSFRDEPDGRSGFADVVPDTGLNHGSAGWGDAGVIVPYVTWLHTGDRRVLEDNFGAIQRWIDAQARDWPEGIRRSRRSYGDWLAPGYEAWEAPTPYELIATAYSAHVADLAGRIAEELGHEEAAQRNRARFEHICRAFQRAYIGADARIKSDEQTAYLLALGFDLVDPTQREAMTEHLLRTFKEKNDHLATGFLGTPLVTPVLSSVGHTELAYKVLLQESYPGWLFSVKNGATTIWERWDSWTPEQGFNSKGMNSFNHYAYGSVVGWFYDTIAGLRPDSEAPGWKRFHVAPTPGGGLTQAEAEVETPYGRARSAWQIEGERFKLTTVVPPNAEAVVSLPVGDASDITERGQPLQQLAEIADLETADGRVSFRIPAGEYQFEAPW